MTLRPATLSDPDLDAIVHHRRAIYLEMKYPADPALDFMSAEFRLWLQRKMEANDYLGWFALADDGAIAAGLGIWLIDCPPSMRAAGRWRAEIVNVFTEPQHRRCGMARSLMRHALEWSQANGISGVMLHTTPYGRPLYESLGFVPRNEMELLHPEARP